MEISACCSERNAQAQEQKEFVNSKKLQKNSMRQTIELLKSIVQRAIVKIANIEKLNARQLNSKEIINNDGTRIFIAGKGY